MVSDNYRLQFITHSNEKYTCAYSARMALEGGCRWIQLRMKNADKSMFEQSAIEVQKMCKDYGATFIVNDDVMLAKRIMADGVHLGKSDMPLVEARKILGSGFIIGCTVNEFRDVQLNITDVAPDYFGCGPFRFTSTKKNLAPILGHAGYKEILRNMRSFGIDIPLIAIGGICKSDILELLHDGADGIALSGSILNAANPVSEMRETVRILYAEK